MPLGPTHHLCIIHRSSIFGFGTGNILSSYLAMTMPLNFILGWYHLHFQNSRCLIIAMPFKILILYVILSN